MKKILIRELTTMAMTEDAGLKLRKVIEDNIDSNDKIILDFESINLFATMFFNASIGYLVLRLTPEKCNELFEIVNISDLGKETYSHSFENAKLIYQNKLKTDNIAEITQDNIELA